MLQQVYRVQFRSFSKIQRRGKDMNPTLARLQARGAAVQRSRSQRRPVALQRQRERYGTVDGSLGLRTSVLVQVVDQRLERSHRLH